jgi:hypothetical protein
MYRLTKSRQIEAALIAGIILCSTATAETLVLRSGSTVTGKLLNMDSHEVSIERCGRPEKYDRLEVKSITLEPDARSAPCGVPLSSKVEFPLGTIIQARLLDYVDSSREPVGQAFRATVETPVTVDGRIVISGGVRMIVKLVQNYGATGQRALTLDVAGVQLGKEWAAFGSEQSPGKAQPSSSPTTRVERYKTSLLDLDSNNVSTQGDKVLVPSGTRLNFVFTRSAQLLAK